jgi:hypothetical protein
MKSMESTRACSWPAKHHNVWNAIVRRRHPAEIYCKLTSPRLALLQKWFAGTCKSKRRGPQYLGIVDGSLSAPHASRLKNKMMFNVSSGTILMNFMNMKTSCAFASHGITQYKNSVGANANIWKSSDSSYIVVTSRLRTEYVVSAYSSVMRSPHLLSDLTCREFRAEEDNRESNMGARGLHTRRGRGDRC